MPIGTAPKLARRRRPLCQPELEGPPHVGHGAAIQGRWYGSEVQRDKHVLCGIAERNDETAKADTGCIM